MSQELQFFSSSQLSDCFSSQELVQLDSQRAQEAANYLVNMSSQEFLNQLSTNQSPPNIYDKLSLSQQSSQPKVTIQQLSNTTTTITANMNIIQTNDETYCSNKNANYYNGNWKPPTSVVVQNVSNAMQDQYKQTIQPTNSIPHPMQQQYNYCQQQLMSARVSVIENKHCFSGPPCDQNNNNNKSQQNYSTTVAKDCFINNTKNDTRLGTAKHIQMMRYLNNCNTFPIPVQESFDVQQQLQQQPKQNLPSHYTAKHSSRPSSNKQQAQQAINLSTKRMRTSSTSTYASSPLYDSEHSSVSESCNDSDTNISKLFSIKEGEESNFNNNRDESNSPFFKRERTPPKLRTSRSRNNNNNNKTSNSCSNRSSSNSNDSNNNQISTDSNSKPLDKDERTVYLQDKKERNRLAAQRLRMKRRQEKSEHSQTIGELEKVNTDTRKLVYNLENEIDFYRRKLRQLYPPPPPPPPTTVV